MKRQVAIYAAALMLGVFVLQWLEYRFMMRTYSTGIFVALIATLFAILGVWVGTRLVGQHNAREFELNEAAIEALGLSPREMEVLGELAIGRSNKEIARNLGISPNTVKTHIAKLFEKLAVSRRTEAVNKSRELRLIP
ncbi:MAG: response regulator transcription factor [Woeseiaceae bacterium]